MKTLKPSADSKKEMTTATLTKSVVYWEVISGATSNVFPTKLLAVKLKKMKMETTTNTLTVNAVNQDMTTTTTTKTVVPETDVVMMFSQVVDQTAAETPLILGINSNTSVYHPAHVRDVAISTAVMSWTSSCTRPTLTTTVKTTHHSLITMLPGTPISTPGGQVLPTERTMIIMSELNAIYFVLPLINS